MAPDGDTADLGPWTYHNVTTAPRAYDIVLCRFPFVENPDYPAPRRSPCLVRTVHVNSKRQAAWVDVAFGTSQNLTGPRARGGVVVQKSAALTRMGLSMGTRFDLTRTAELPWSHEWFPIPAGRFSPLLGHLEEEYIERVQNISQHLRRQANQKR